jgi:hypothetical protein
MPFSSLSRYVQCKCLLPPCCARNRQHQQQCDAPRWRLAHASLFTMLLTFALSAPSARAESSRLTNKRCSASTITSASRSQASPRMHAYSGPSHRLFPSHIVHRCSDANCPHSLSCSVSACMQQLHAPAGHGIQDGLQPTRACEPPRVRHCKQCVIALPFFFLSRNVYTQPPQKNNITSQRPR